MVLHPFDGSACSFEDPSCSGGDFRANPITRDEYDLMRCHFQLQVQA